MTNPADLIDHLQAQARDQIQLAVIANAVPVAEMHIDLALFTTEQARAVEALGGVSGKPCLRSC